MLSNIESLEKYVQSAQQKKALNHAKIHLLDIIQNQGDPGKELISEAWVHNSRFIRAVKNMIEEYKAIGKYE